MNALLQESTSSSDVDKNSLCQDHLFAIFCVFSGLSLVNYVLMNAAANVFHSTGLVVLTFQDAMSLMEQVCSDGFSLEFIFRETVSETSPDY